MLYNVTNGPASVAPVGSNKVSIVVGGDREFRSTEESKELNDRSSSAEHHPVSEKRALQRKIDAVDFRPEETSLHLLYESTRTIVEEGRRENIGALRSLIKNQTYQTNVELVAERILSSGEFGRL
ncbi:MAG: hypothetical protein KTR25_07450 [Myxococcales bacterium]|nr:hypothetical protein [Myxococcales bacterium]